MSYVELYVYYESESISGIIYQWIYTEYICSYNHTQTIFVWQHAYNAVDLILYFRLRLDMYIRYLLVKISRIINESSDMNK